MTKYSPGDVIVDCYPLVHSLSGKEIGARCNFCLVSQEDLKKCSKCKGVYYCGSTCQKSDWKSIHKHKECEIYRFCQENNLTLQDCDRLLLRLYLKEKFDGESPEFQSITRDGRTRSLADLMTNLEHIKTDERRMASFMHIGKRLEHVQALNMVDDGPRLLELFAIICINSFSILDLSLNEIASGLYIAGSAFDHSCVPNAAPVFDGRRLQIRAIKAIEPRDDVFVNYLDLKLSTPERAARLKDQYYFTCSCARCRHPNGDEVSSCSQIKFLDEEFDRIITEECNWLDAYLIGIRSLPLYEEVYQRFHPDLTVQLFRIVKVRYLIDDEKLSEAAIGNHGVEFLMTKLMEAIKITHGAHHSLYTEFTNMLG
ncbi:Histone-lysine N-methyltransferase SMYD3 [Halotydeus destructor]|nr:Histone-lysine N-methyltransferase SMYD3 [Halotydeus destructor]